MGGGGVTGCVVGGADGGVTGCSMGGVRGGAKSAFFGLGIFC